MSPIGDAAGRSQREFGATRWSRRWVTLCRTHFRRQPGVASLWFRRRRIACRPILSGAVSSDGLGILSEGALAAPAYAYALVNARRRDVLAGKRILRDWAAWWGTAAPQTPQALGGNPLGTPEVALLTDGVSSGDLPR